MTRPRRVLLTADAVGGVWQYATDLARGLADRGIEPVLALLGPPPSAAQREAARGLMLIETGAALDWLVDDAAAAAAAGRRVAEAAADLGCDVAQLNMPSLAAAAPFTMPTVAVAHSCLATWWAAVRNGPLPADFAWRDALTGAGLRRAGAVVAPSAAFAAATMAAHRLPRRPLVVHNGRRALPVEDAPTGAFAFTAGRLWDEGKNVGVLDAAAGKLAMAFKAAGPTTGPQRQTMPLRHLQGLGTLDEAGLARCLSARPLFASAARYEPFGLAVLEAAQAGCPLLLSDIPTFRELWEGAATFVAPDDADGFVRAIERLIGDPAARDLQGRAAAERARRYTPGAMAAGMIGVYAGLPAGVRQVAA